MIQEALVLFSAALGCKITIFFLLYANYIISNIGVVALLLKHRYDNFYWKVSGLQAELSVIYITQGKVTTKKHD